jgi:hypothetical protein
MRGMVELQPLVTVRPKHAMRMTLEQEKAADAK